MIGGQPGTGGSDEGTGEIPEGINVRKMLDIEMRMLEQTDDALLKALERHTADLVEKYSVLPTLESSKKQESEKSPEEIIRIKREQEEKKQDVQLEWNQTGKVNKKKRKESLSLPKMPSTSKNPPRVRSKVGSKLVSLNQKRFQLMSPTDKVIMRLNKLLRDIPISDEGQVKRSGGNFIRWYCGRIGKEEFSKADLEGPAFMMVKAARYLDFGLEELVPSLWVESERDYDISAAYGITHWWFNRKEFYINKHSEPSNCDAVRSHMRIISVISIKTYERYIYNYLREIVLCRHDYNKYKISEKDFKSLHPNDFEDLNILHIQGKLDHLPKQDKVNLHNAVSLWTRNIVIRKRVEDLQLGIESYQTKINLEQPNWDTSDFLFKEDYTIVNKPRAVIYRDRDDNRKMMRINEVHKFSDGTLTRIKEKLDFMVKDFKLFKFNKGMENRKWTEDDKRRSEDFIEVIERRLKIRRIFQSLESFVGGCLRDINYRLISRTE
ncbi:hypothetical protein Tco_0327860 [Tanacetum coccineum]